MSDIYPFFSGFLLFSILYLIFSTKFAADFFQKTGNYDKVIIFILALQILFSGLFRKEVGDVALFGSAGWHLRQRIDFYFIDAGSGSYPFFPFLIFLHAFLNFLSETFSLFTFSFYLKLILIAVLYLISRRINHSAGKINSLKFLAAPVTYMVVIYHGQIDIILILFYLLSTDYYSGLFYGASVATKTWSLVFLPLIFKFRKNISHFLYFVGVSVLFVLADIYLYLKWVRFADFNLIFKAVTKAGGPIGGWGVTYLLTKLNLNSQILFFGIFLVGLMVTYILVLRKKIDIISSSFLLILGIYIFIPRFGIQYLFWVYPFLFLVLNKLEKTKVEIFIFLSSAYLFFSYSSLISGREVKIIAELTGFALWLYIIYWFYRLIRRLSYN